MNIFVATYLANKEGPLYMSFDDEARAVKLDPWLVRVRDIENAYVMNSAGRPGDAGCYQTMVLSGPSHTE
jgi:hypothetical protein